MICFNSTWCQHYLYNTFLSATRKQSSMKTTLQAYPFQNDGGKQVAFLQAESTKKFGVVQNVLMLQLHQPVALWDS